MTQTPPFQAADILAGMTEMKGALTLLASESRLHTEILARIVQLLTPAEESTSPSVHEMLAALIGRLDRQSVMLKEMLDGQDDLRRALPQEMAQAVATAMAPLNGQQGGGVANTPAKAPPPSPQAQPGANGSQNP